MTPDARQNKGEIPPAASPSVVIPNERRGMADSRSGRTLFYHKIHQIAQEIVPQGILMFCGECGTQNPDTNSFCNNCGKPLKRSERPVPSGTIEPAQQPAAAPVPQATAAAPAGTQRNWLGAASIALGIVSWIAYPYLAGIAAIALGGYSAYRIRNSTGKIALLSIVGIAIALASMVFDKLYFVLFPVDIMDMSYLGSTLLLVLK